VVLSKLLATDGMVTEKVRLLEALALWNCFRVSARGGGGNFI
jgi:hypothetical protein